MTESFRNALAEALQMSPNDLSMSTQLANGWDSVATITAIALMDHFYGVTLAASDLARCATVADLIRLGEDKSQK
jgi:acyl carrier protein